MLHSLAEQMKEWAKLLEDGKTPTESIVAGLREVAADVQTSLAYSREEKLGDESREAALRAEARGRYCASSDNNIEIDQDSDFSPSGEGCWASSCWVWVPDETGEWA